MPWTLNNTKGHMGFADRAVRSRGVRWTHVLCFAGAVASLGNLALIKSALGRTDSTGYITSLLRALALPEGAASRRGVDADRLQTWADAVSAFVAAQGSLGWGTRTGGVVVAGSAREICGVPFAGNTLRSSQEFPPVQFKANTAMIASSGDKTEAQACKRQLEQAARGGWHQGQLFFYRLPVDRPGLYVVRLTLVFNHNDERRGDGITLGVDDVLKVRLQCLETPGRTVVPIKSIGEGYDELMGVVEFPTVALGGEILLEAEGIYTCIGLSLVETFFHDELHRRPPVVPATGSSRRRGGKNGGHDNEHEKAAAAGLAPLRAAWDGGAGAVCAHKYASDANRRSSLQTVLASSSTAREQRYFDEWARRERLEDSAGRYCRPRTAPALGERGWTWAGHSERVAREREEATRKDEELKARRQEAFVGDSQHSFQAAVDAAEAGGVSAVTATALASEALDRVLENAAGHPLTLEDWQEVTAHAGRAGEVLAKARGGAGKKKPLQPGKLLSPALQQQLESARRRTVANNEARRAAAGGGVDRSELTQRRRRLFSAAAAAVPADENESTTEGRGRPDGCRGSVPCQSRPLLSSSSPKSLSEKSGRALPPLPARGEWEEQEGGGGGGFGQAGGIGSDLPRRSLLAPDSEVLEVVGTGIIAENGSTALNRNARLFKSARSGARAGAGAGAGAGATDPTEAVEIRRVIRVPRLDSPDADDGKGEGKGEDGSTAGRSRRVNPEDPIPPPACPSRLVELLEEALHVEGRSKKTAAAGASAANPRTLPGADAAVAAATTAAAASVAETPATAGSADSTTGQTKREDGGVPDAGWSPAVVAALIADGAAAAANRARSRAERGDGLGSTLGRARWEASLGRGVLPTWLAGVAGVERDGGTAGKKTAAAAAAESFSPAAVLPRSVVAQQALGSGFQAIAAYRAHEVEGWNGGGSGGGSSGVADGPGAAPENANGDGSSEARSGDGGGAPRPATGPPGSNSSEDEGGGPTAQGAPRLLPVRFTGFTWDGVTVVAKETVAGCARTARPAPPAPLSAPPWDAWGSSEEWDQEGDFGGGGGGGGGGSFSRMDHGDTASCGEQAEDTAAAAARPAEAAVPGKDGVGGNNYGAGRSASSGDDGGGGGGSGRRLGEGGRAKTRPPCLKVEAAFVPTEKIVVDIVVPVSAGLVPRLLTLLPQMERLGKGWGCTPVPPSNPLAPQCNDADHYAPAFWPERLGMGGQASSGWASGLDLSEVLGAGGGGGRVRGLRGGGKAEGRGDLGKNEKSAAAAAAAAAGGGGKMRGNFRVVVVTEDPGVEALLHEYDVETVFVLSEPPFSKAAAIQDASGYIPDDHIMFIHDADLFPPCSLPDALRQTVVQGVQAVNLLLAYENQPTPGTCVYPLSTFGPMAMYASDFRAVGGIADANSGRWGYEDTAFLHKVMLGDNPLGVLRVHLPGLVHRWHEITPWKCLVWVWGGSPSGSGGEGGEDGLVVKNTEDPPRRSTADVLGA